MRKKIDLSEADLLALLSRASRLADEGSDQTLKMLLRRAVLREKLQKSKLTPEWAVRLDTNAKPS